MALTGQGYDRELRPGVRPRRLRALLLGLATFLAAGVITAAAMLIEQPLHSKPAAATVSSAPPGGTTSTPAGLSVQEQAAQGLAELLAQSVMDRSSIVAAVDDINQCGPKLHQDPQTLQTAVTSRQRLVSRLASLPDRSALSADMLAALTSAWQNSIQADQDYAQWARDEIANGCTANSASDRNAQAAIGPDTQATTGKKTFVGLWNPIATHYRLTTYLWNQL